MKRRTAALGLWAAASLALLPGCAQYYYGEHATATSTDLVEANRIAADRLLQDALIDPDRPVLVATLVSVDQLGESSRLGRTITEQISGRLVQRGVLVIEPRMRASLAMSPAQGELLLSREVREVSQSHDAQAVVVGTYAASASALYISLKLVTPVGNAVVAAHNYAVPMDENVRVLLASGGLRY